MDSLFTSEWTNPSRHSKPLSIVCFIERRVPRCPLLTKNLGLHHVPIFNFSTGSPWLSSGLLACTRTMCGIDRADLLSLHRFRKGFEESCRESRHWSKVTTSDTARSSGHPSNQQKSFPNGPKSARTEYFLLEVASKFQAHSVASTSKANFCKYRPYISFVAIEWGGICIPCRRLSSVVVAPIYRSQSDRWSRTLCFCRIQRRP
jgi:hypothetical protein